MKNRTFVTNDFKVLYVVRQIYSLLLLSILLKYICNKPQ